MTDYHLPDIKLDTSAYKADQELTRAQRNSFSPQILAAAISTGCSTQAIKRYLRHYGRSTVAERINELVEGFPLIAYAADAADQQCVELLLENGCNAEAKVFDNIPVLAFTIMRCKWTLRNVKDTVISFLAYGVNPRVIPLDMWKDPIKTPQPKLDAKYKKHLTSAKWCTAEQRAILVDRNALNLSIRYALWRASHLDSQYKRKRQIASINNMMPLFRVPYHMVGQMSATMTVVDEVYSHLANQREKPLVMAFAGLSGHGKTELATQLGRMLSLPMLDLDCAQIQTVHNLLGPPVGYKQNSTGSALNNHLVAHSGRRCVIFLDEFDKTEKECRDALLKVLDNGMYRDRKTNDDVDASRYIWILATNLGDKQIRDFYRSNLVSLQGEEAGKISLEPLNRELSTVYRKAFSPAVAGRVDIIVPFFPFSQEEAAVVAHKFFLKFQDDARKPIALADPAKRTIGHSFLSMVDDGSVCQHIAKERYVEETGARSIEKGVDRLRMTFALAYSRTDEEVTEDVNAAPLDRYIFQLNPVTETTEEISVVEDDAEVAA